MIDDMTNIVLAAWMSSCLLVIGASAEEILELKKRQTPPTCTDGYENVEGSTMCLTDSPDFIEGTDGVSAADQETILRLHNEFRAGVSPTAAAMPKIYWDDELARIANKWAKQCILAHESWRGKSRFIPAYGMSPGQNGGAGHPNWAAQITSWHKEVENYRYGEDYRVYLPEGKLIGHYTQVVQEASVLVGCGFAKCDNYRERFYYCDYLKAQSNIRTPYQSGETCSGCPDACNAETKLCDCEGKFCFNGGTLDKNTCQCSCTTSFEGDKCLEAACGGKKCENGGALIGGEGADKCDCKCTKLYTGTNCETKQCPESDPQWCTSWHGESCHYMVFLRESCPFYCKNCPISK